MEKRLQEGEWSLGLVCAVVQARGVDGVGKVVAGKMETGGILEAEQL